MMNYYTDVLKKYAVFTGRASRAEYWYFVLFNLIVSILISIISRLVRDTNGVLSGLYSLAVLIPSLAVSVRRLHDTGRSAWWLLINLIPLVGWVWYIVLLILKGDAGENKYGPSPKEAATAVN